jgi:hypothetical protein
MIMLYAGQTRIRDTELSMMVEGWACASVPHMWGGGGLACTGRVQHGVDTHVMHCTAAHAPRFPGADMLWCHVWRSHRPPCITCLQMGDRGVGFDLASNVCVLCCAMACNMQQSWCHHAAPAAVHQRQPPVGPGPQWWEVPYTHALHPAATVSTQPRFPFPQPTRQAPGPQWPA